jgi:uncharacterized membrane protein YGL010W
LPLRESLFYFIATFATGWAIQFFGHIVEGKKPALADNLMQIFNAPLFLSVEILFFLGFRRGLKEEVENIGRSS